jgi:hypothetical protein
MANLGTGENQKPYIGELAVEIEALAIGNKVTAIVVYTGDLASIDAKEVTQSFMNAQCMQS